MVSVQNFRCTGVLAITAHLFLLSTHVGNVVLSYRSTLLRTVGLYRGALYRLRHCLLCISSDFAMCFRIVRFSYNKQ